MDFFTPLILAVQMLIGLDADLYEIIGLSLQVSLSVRVVSGLRWLSFCSLPSDRTHAQGPDEVGGAADAAGAAGAAASSWWREGGGGAAPLR